MKSYFYWVAILIFFFTQTLSSQTFDLVEVPAPIGLDFNRIFGQIEDEIYLDYFDANYNQILLSFDGETINNVVLPTGYSLQNLYPKVDANYYAALNDANFNTDLAIIENGEFTVFPAPGNASDLAQFIYEDGGDIYLLYFDITSFDPVVRIFDGANFSDLNLPAGFEFDLYLGALNGLHYFLLEDNNFDVQLFSFDGTNFTLIPTTAGLQFPNIIFQTEDEIVFSAFDFDFNQLLFKLDESGVSDFLPPNGFSNIGNQPFEFKTDYYFGYSDADFDNQTLFKYVNGDAWIMYDNPSGFEYVTGTSGGILEEEAYIQLQDLTNFDRHLALFNGTEIEEIFTSPVNKDFNNLYLPFKGGFLTGFSDIVNFEESLFYFKDANFQQIPPPVAGYSLNNYDGSFLNKAFFSYREGYYENTLYYLALNALPVSADDTVSTNVETPYNFIAGDFPFSDADDDSIFEGIQISSLPTKGILHLNGGQVNPEDIISSSELGTLFYVPLDGGAGSPYDQFQFKVWDGFSVSELSYSMYIDVIGTVGVNSLAEGAIELFPNPANQFVIIALKNDFELENLNVSIVNEAGVFIEHQNIESLNTQLSLEHLSTGSYFLLLYNQKHSIVHKLNVVK